MRILWWKPTGDTISAAHLSLAAPSAQQAPGFQGTLKELEREAIRQALLASDKHRKKAAQRLGIGLCGCDADQGRDALRPRSAPGSA